MDAGAGAPKRYRWNFTAPAGKKEGERVMMAKVK